MRCSVVAFRDLGRNVLRLLVIAWKCNARLVVVFAALSVAGAAVPFALTGSLAVLINALIQGSVAAAPGLTAAVAMIIVASIVPDILCGVLECVNRVFDISMDETVELLFLRRKGEIDLAAYEDPKFNDLLNRAEARGTYPMTQLVETQFWNLRNIVQLVAASAIIVAFDWKVFFMIVAGTAPKLVIETRYGRAVWGVYNRDAPRANNG